MKTYTITGQVTDTKTKKGISNLKVEAWDNDLLFNDLVGSAVTDESGAFSIEFTQKHFKECFLDRKPDLFFKVYKDRQLIASSEKSVLWNIGESKKQITIEVELSEKDVEGAYLVKGRVFQPDQKPLAKAVVRADDKDLRHEQALGRTITDGKGNYQIHYTRDQFRRAEKQRADLIVRAFDPETGRLLLDESDIIFNAGLVEVVDLIAKLSYSEYECYMAELTPVRDGVPVADLTEKDIHFLHGETSIPAHYIEFLSIASRLGKQTDLPPEIFYGLFRQKLPTLLSDLIEKDVEELQAASLASFKAHIIPLRFQKNLDDYLKRLSKLKETDPGVHRKKEKAKLRRLLKMDDLDDAKVEKIVEKAGHATLVSDKLLKEMVESDELTEPEAKSLGLTVTLHNLLDDNPELAKRLKTGTFSQIPNGKIEHIEDLTAFEKSDWLEILEQEEAEPPDGWGREGYAALMAKKIENLYPTKTLLTRVTAKAASDIHKDLNKLQPLFERNNRPFTKSFDELDVTDLDASAIEDLRTCHNRVKSLVNTYPGLDLHSILNDPQLPADAKDKQIRTRIEMIPRFYSQNPDKELLFLDYSPESLDIQELDFSGFDEAEKRMVLKTVKAFQRINLVTRDSDHTTILLSTGYHSPIQIANVSSKSLINQTGLDEPVAIEYRQKSSEMAAKTIIGEISIINEMNYLLDKLPFDNTDPALGDYLKKIDGWEALFGSLDYCNCEHCRSIFGPAAYFVDLMRYIHTHILEQFPETEDDNLHDLHLKSRRPDLWKLSLTCEHTNQLIPYLDIINEVLENFIALYLGFEEGDLPVPGASDRSDVENIAYKGLQDTTTSFNLPFSLPLERLALYLAHFDLKRGDISRALGMPNDDHAAAVLNLSRAATSIHDIREHEVVVQPNRDISHLRQTYGLHFMEAGDRITYRIDGDETTENDVQPLLKATGLTRAELEQLIETQFVCTGNLLLVTRIESITIKGEKSVPFGEDASVQNDIERIRGLTRVALDRMHRFTRLWRKLPWTIPELDLVLHHLSSEDLVYGIQAATLPYLVDILSIQERFELSVEAVCCLWSNIPKKSVVEDKDSLFNRLFNLPDFVHLDGEFPKSSHDYLHPALRDTPPDEPDYSTYRLTAGLNIDDQTLYLLICGLATPLGISDLISVDLEDRKFTLSLEHLSLLYRHASLAKKLGLVIPDLFRLIALADTIRGDYIDNLNDLTAFIEFYDWLESTDYTLEELELILLPAVDEDSAISIEAETICSNILAKIHTNRALFFNSSVFAFAEGVTEPQSEEIIAANTGAIDKAAGNRFCCKDAFFVDGFENDHVELNIPSGISADPIDLRKLLLTYAAESKPVFDDTLFTDIADLTEEESQAIVAANPSWIEPVPLDNTYWLTPSYSSASLIIPDKISFPINKATGLLSTYEAKEIISSYLAREMGIAVEKMKALLELSGADLTSPEYIHALHERDASEDLCNLFKMVLPLKTLFKDPALDAAAIDYVQSDSAPIGAFAPGAVTLENVRLLIQFIRFLKKFKDSDGGIQDYFELLSAFDDAERKYYTNSDERDAAKNTLSKALDAEVGLVLTAHDEIKRLEESLALDYPDDFIPPETALDTLVKMQDYVDKSQRLGVSGEVLTMVVSNDYDKLNQAANSILSAFRTKYDDEEKWEETIEPFENKIQGRKRDALTDYLIHAYPSEAFGNMNDLYHHFLLDVELEGCARTSRLVAANSSLQLYVHRVLMHLEQDVHETIELTMTDEAILEWEWRKNYRVWEANRKVFLYPENYLEPDLRDNKTPLFEELESTLLQQEINEDTVLEAYASYMRGFDEVANLKIAGSYHDIGDGRDFLHLFGVTADDPIVYYYREVENAYHGERDDTKGIIWHPWRKIDVQIPVKKVSPIVFNDRLFLFWLEINTTQLNSDFENGGSSFSGYKHTLSLKYTKLLLDGSWSAPAKIKLDSAPFNKGDGVVEDLLAFEYLDIARGEDPDSDYWGTRPRYGSEDDEHISKKDYATSNERLRRTEQDRLAAGERAILELPEDERIRLLLPAAQFESLDSYSLKGFQWERVYPDPWDSENSIVITGCNFRMKSRIDFYRSAIGRQFHSGNGISGRILSWKREDNVLYNGLAPDHLRGWLTPYSFASVLIDQRNTDYYGGLDFALRGTDYYPGAGSGAWGAEEFEMVANSIYFLPVARNLDSAAEISVVNGSYIRDGILDTEGDLLYFQQSPAGLTLDYLVRRINTTLSDETASILFSGGVEALLRLETQEALKEGDLPVGLEPDCFVIDKGNAGQLDFEGPFGVYFREIFFHIPFLIANHLSSQGKYAEGQKWYHYIFDPTAIATGGETRPEDRNWRYLEFRNNTIESLRKQLRDKDAIEAYKKDSFNPHAIARLPLRFSAYQKAVVMKYVDNLLDWGDHLFAQDTMESINEATLLYVLAADILGQRPAELGDCGQEHLGALNYDDISAVLNDENEFLIEMFHSVHQKIGGFVKASDSYTIEPSMVHAATKIASDHITMLAYKILPNNETDTYGRGVEITTADEMGVSRVGVVDRRAFSVTKNLFQGFKWKNEKEGKDFKYVGPILSLGSQIPAFCIPENKTLMGYWDRVEDRLFKIRNCMNFSGVRRELSLFAPEIDPMLLVRAKAAGLSLADVLNSISGNLPPYRFSYIIERAKGYAAMLQGFGSALLSTFEKRDVEELNQLRNVHQKNILTMTSKMREDEYTASLEAVQSLGLRRQAVAYRRDYYQRLKTEGNTDSEQLQLSSRNAAHNYLVAAFAFDILASCGFLIPQIGSPFAITFGGKQLGDSSMSYGQFCRTMASIKDSKAAGAGLRAGFNRRDQGWQHQADLADKELSEIDKQIQIAQIRADIADRLKSIHYTTIDQQDEVYEFYRDKFTNLGLYTWLSTSLQSLYREAYNNAYALARLAEQAYRFERGNDAAELIGPDHWDASRAGLLAGERLLMDLQNLERKFLETNYRTIEIDQAFSLTQIDPAALIELKQTGSCQFAIPEIYFNLFYPGHYRRKIKAVRLTIPCITGPYTNVSANLRLTGSEIRNEPDLDANLLQVPLTRTVAIATSTAQNDAGVFELNFRDERYMPFEGVGAISQWELSLPINFRQFDYSTINDVILHISYTAEEDSNLRTDVEGSLDTLEGSIFDFLKDESLQRIFSLRQEFSSAFNTLLHSPVNQQVTIELTDRHFPIFLKGRELNVRSAFLVLGTEKDQEIGTFQLSFNNSDIPSDTGEKSFQRESDFGDLFTANVTDLIPEITLSDGQIIKSPIGEHSITIKNAGGPPSSDPPVIQAEKLKDIYIYLEYGLN